MKFLGTLIACTLVGLACYCAIRQGAQSLFCTHSYTLHLDALLAGEVKKEISRVVSHHFNKRVDKDLLKNILQPFPYLTRINTHQVRPELVHLQIVAQKPWLRINDDFVMTAQGTLVQAACYNNSAVSSLFSMGVAPEVLQNPTEMAVLHHTIASLNPDILQDFSVYWVNRFDIHLGDKKDSWFSLCCEHNSMPTRATLEKCMHIKRHIQSSSQQNLKNAWVADMRFTEQIIIAESQLRGSRNG